MDVLSPQGATLDVLSFPYRIPRFGIWDLGLGGLENRANYGAVCRISLGRPVNIGRDGVQQILMVRQIPA